MKLKNFITTCLLIVLPSFAQAQAINITGSQYHYYGPNASWGGYLQVGGNGRQGDMTSVVSTNGNLHLDSKNNRLTYINWYSKTNTLINGQGGFVGIGTTAPQKPLHITSSAQHHQLRLQGTGGMHSWVQFYPNGAGMKNWQAGANVNGFSVYNISDGAYRFTIANSGAIGIGTHNPDANAGVHMYQNKYTLYGPNTSWGGLLQVGGNGRQSGIATVVATNGNLHLDSKDAYSTYINHYSGGNTFINTNSGSVGIGTTATGTHKLAVEGTIGARKVMVETGSWSDFVFAPDYVLKDLDQVATFIKTNGHLPDVPSEKEVIENGIDLGDMDATLLQKIEELTLYTIAQEKKIKALEKENEEIDDLKARLAKLEALLIKDKE